MKRVQVSLIILFSSVLFFSGCYHSDGELKVQSQNGESSKQYVVQSKSTSPYVRLMYAFVNGKTTAIVKARRGQPFGAPYDGTMYLYVKEKNFWKSYLMHRYPGTTDETYYLTWPPLDNKYKLTFYICLNVFGQCFYDGFPSDPYVIQRKYTGDGSIPDGIVGGKISLSSAYIDKKNYGSFDVYTLKGSIYLNKGSFPGWNIIATYEVSPSVTGTISAYFDTYIDDAEKWKFSKMISVGWAGDPVPTFPVSVKIMSKNVTIAIDDYFGKLYHIDDTGIQ